MLKNNRLAETVLLSTHNICFGWEIRKLVFRYALLTKALVQLNSHLFLQFTVCKTMKVQINTREQLSQALIRSASSKGCKQAVLPELHCPQTQRMGKDKALSIFKPLTPLESCVFMIKEWLYAHDISAKNWLILRTWLISYTLCYDFMPASCTIVFAFVELIWIRILKNGLSQAHNTHIT